MEVDGQTPDSIERLAKFSTITSYLDSLDICCSCLLRIAGELSPAILRNAQSVVAVSKLPCRASTLPDLNRTQDPEPTCPCCLGLLQKPFCDVVFLESVVKFIKDSGYSMQTFWCSLTLPNAAEIRVRTFDDYWDSTVEDEKLFSRLSVKDAWKAIVTPVFSSGFSAKWIGHEGLEINLEIDHSGVDDECDVLKKRFPKLFQEKRGADGKVKRIITRHALENLLKSTSPSEFRRLVPFPPKRLSEPAKLRQISCIPCSVYLGGRYLKYSRSVSQTPWFIEDERKGESSVEELICRKISARFQAGSWRFLASGREDIDVLCLGEGRPFGVELIGAKVAIISESDLISLEEDINGSTKDIEVLRLQMVSRMDTTVLKTGEEEKTKTYSALCQMEENVSMADLSLLNRQKEFTSKQKTPVRVLHRRVNAERTKVIHEVSAASLENSKQFRLLLKTQAGTYVKEFIHGDFGRTEPSISSILGKEVECEELDVVNVDLEWPPH